jgi:hypothetical protein
MNRSTIIKTVLIAALGSFCTLRPEAESCSNFKVRAGLFIPQSTLFREIYGSAAPLIQAEVVTSICEHIDFWANIDGIFKHGESIGLCNDTKISMASLSAGFRFPHQLVCMNSLFYVGVGASLAGIWLRNASTCCPCEKVSKGSIGIILKSGISHEVCDCFLIEFFADYNYQPVCFQRHLTVGGGKIGVGFGYSF